MQVTWFVFKKKNQVHTPTTYWNTGDRRPPSFSCADCHYTIHISCLWSGRYNKQLLEAGEATCEDKTRLSRKTILAVSADVIRSVLDSARNSTSFTLTAFSLNLLMIQPQVGTGVYYLGRIDIESRS